GDMEDEGTIHSKARHRPVVIEEIAGVIKDEPGTESLNRLDDVSGMAVDDIEPGENRLTRECAVARRRPWSKVGAPVDAERPEIGAADVHRVDQGPEHGRGPDVLTDSNKGGSGSFRQGPERPQRVGNRREAYGQFAGAEHRRGQRCIAVLTGPGMAD